MHNPGQRDSDVWPHPTMQSGVNKVKGVGNDVADTVSGATSKLPPNLLPFVGVVLVLSFLPSLFALIGGIFGGQ